MINLPHTIQTRKGEQLTFQKIILENGVEKLLVTNQVQPGAGPILHTHWQQEESLTVTHGKMGWQILGQPPQYAFPGDSVTFTRGTPHRFWNDGEDLLRCDGWISPPHSIVFFLDTIYAAINKSATDRPDAFDAAWLLTRYASEYDLPEIPTFVKKVIMPIQVMVGKFLGKYKHFKNAPIPLPPVR
ncbi:MAG: cupin domain-containing protein [Saprospiraceae bacterium]|nr:cupin domain-containing protein [Saprospiraceae bacterium]